MTSRAIELAYKAARSEKSRLLGCGIDDLERFYALAQAQALRDAAKEFTAKDYAIVRWNLERMADELERVA